MMAYLNQGPDLLELAVKKANYPIIVKYLPMTVPNAVEEASGIV